MDGKPPESLEIPISQLQKMAEMAKKRDAFTARAFGLKAGFLGDSLTVREANVFATNDFLGMPTGREI